MLALGVIGLFEWCVEDGPHDVDIAHVVEATCRPLGGDRGAPLLDGVHRGVGAHEHVGAGEDPSARCLRDALAEGRRRLVGLTSVMPVGSGAVVADWVVL